MGEDTMKCPNCKGDGGEYEAVLWYGAGGGPYYECDYCSGSGHVNILMWCYWWIVVVFWEETLPRLLA